MKVLVAGSTGALGVPTVRALVGSGHEVLGLTRSRDKAHVIEEHGATPVFADVFEPDELEKIFDDHRPEGVLQLLNSLPKRGPMRPRELEGTNRLRIEGTANLLSAARRSGVRRYVAESMIFGYGYGNRRDSPLTESAPFAQPTEFAAAQPALEALGSIESQVLEASSDGIEGVVLRYGLFYGPGVGSTEFMISLLRKRLFVLPGGGRSLGSWIHVDDGATAAVAALERAPAGSVFNVVDDRPATLGEVARCLSETLSLPGPKKVPLWTARLGGAYAALMAKSRLPVSNEKIKSELDWRPAYPTIEEGIATLRGGRTISA